MDKIEDEGMTLLAPLRDAEPGAESGVDIGSAMRVGRRRSRRRVVAGALAAAVVTALALVAVPAGLKAWQRSVEPAVAPGEFSIARHVITVGTAGGFKTASMRTGRYEQVVELTKTDSSPGYARVTAYAPGHSPAIDMGMPAPDVNGRPAYWVPRQQEPTLAMQEGDIWVIVRTSGPDMDIVDRAHRVAQAVEFNADVPVRLCFTLKGLPGWFKDYGLRVVGVQVHHIGLASYILMGTSDDTGSPVLSIGVGRDIPNAPTNETVNGHEARVEPNSVIVYNVDGKGTAVAVRNDVNTSPIADVATLKELVSEVQPVPDVADPDTWVRY